MESAMQPLESGGSHGGSSSIGLEKEYQALRYALPAWFVDVLDGQWLAKLVTADADKELIVRKALMTHKLSMPTDFDSHVELPCTLLFLTQFILARAYKEKLDLQDQIDKELPYLNNRITIEDLIHDVRHLQLDIEFYQKKVRTLTDERNKERREKDRIIKEKRILQDKLEERDLNRARMALDQQFGGPVDPRLVPGRGCEATQDRNGY